MSAPAALDLCGLNEGPTVGVTTIDPAQALAVARLVSGHARSLDDQRELTRNRKGGRH